MCNGRGVDGSVGNDRGGQVSSVARVERQLVGCVSGVRVASDTSPASQASSPIDAGVSLMMTNKSSIAMKSVKGVGISFSIGLTGRPRKLKENTEEGNLKIATR